jgi:predicted CoA-binding protein
MKHMTRDEALHKRVLQRARTVAIIGASPNPARHSYSVLEYLKSAGYDVIPIRPDGTDVAGVPAFATLADVAGPIDLVVIFRKPEAVPSHLDEAAARDVDVVWLQPGVWSRQAQTAADRHGLTLVKELCIAEEHRHVSQPAGHPTKWGVHVRRRKPSFEDNRRRPEDAGYVAGGGGGHVAGGGVRAIVGEKKMVKGGPSPRSGRFKPKPQ